MRWWLTSPALATNRRMDNRQAISRRAWLPLCAFSLLALVACGGQVQVSSFGRELDGRPAPDFQLTDHRGNPIQLSDLHGKAVALTFIYTNCPDVCLLTAETFRQAFEMLPESKREHVALVAVTVDPERDSPERLAQFSEVHGLEPIPTWFALTGDRQDLQAVWQAYGIDPGTMLLRSVSHQHADSTPDPANPEEPGDPSLLIHTDAVYIIDRDGRERAFGRSDADPAALASLLASLT